jgi:hypothetical protein
MTNITVNQNNWQSVSTNSNEGVPPVELDLKPYSENSILELTDKIFNIFTDNFPEGINKEELKKKIYKTVKESIMGNVNYIQE